MVLDYPIEYVFDKNDQVIFDVWARMIGYAAGMMRGFRGRTAHIVEDGYERMYNHMRSHTQEFNADDQDQEAVANAANPFPEVVEDALPVASAPRRSTEYQSSSNDSTNSDKHKRKVGRKSS